MIDFLDAWTLTPVEIREELDLVRQLLRDRNVAIAGGVPAESFDLYSVVLDHAEVALRDSGVAVRVAEIVRLCRKARIRVHLVFGLELGFLRLEDFGSAVLRDMATQPDVEHVSVIDRDGLTVADLQHAA